MAEAVPRGKSSPRDQWTLITSVFRKDGEESLYADDYIHFKRANLNECLLEFDSNYAKPNLFNLFKSMPFFYKFDFVQYTSVCDWK